MVLARQVGHTKTAIEGVKEANGIYVCHSREVARRVASEYGVEAIGIEQLDRLRGVARPVVFDHVVVENALRDASMYERKSKALLEDLEKYKSRLELKSKKVIDQANEIEELCKRTDYLWDLIEWATTVSEHAKAFRDALPEGALLFDAVSEFETLLEKTKMFKKIDDALEDDNV